MATNEMQADALSFRLSPQQESLWSGAEASRDRLVCAAMELPARVSTDDVRTALLRVIERHEILRTTFPRRAGMRVPGQRVNEQLEPLWVAEVWSRGGAPAEAVANLLAGEAERELSLETGPVVCARLVSAEGHPHLLLLTIPSACADVMALRLVALELATILGYGDSELADEPLQYADYAEWRNELLAGEGAAEGRAFWAERMPDQSPPLPFAFRGAVRPARLRRVSVPVDPEALAEAASAFGTSEAVFLEACWHAHISRLLADSEIVLATTLDGRTQEEIREAIGPYAQAVPLRSRIEAETTLAEVVDQVRRGRSLAAQWQEYAGGDVLQSVESCCRAGFTAIDSPLTNSETRLIAVTGSAASLDLELTLTGSAVGLHHDPRVLDAEDAAELARQLAALVASAAAVGPAIAVADLDLTTPSDRERLAAGFRTPLSAPGEEPAHELFARWAERRPDAVAVVAEDGSLSYGELDVRANRLSHHLQALGVGPNVAVGLCMDRSAAMIEGLLGILKAGGAYVPLNFEHPAARLAHQLEETRAPVLVTQERLLERLPPFGGAVVCIDRDATDIASRPGSPPAAGGGADDLVYVMYTSGSTGLPKGVEVTHRNLTGYVAAVSQALELAEDERLGFAAVSAISTDLGNTSVFGALLTGGTLYLIPPEVSVDGPLFASYLEANEVDVLKIAPSQLASLVAGADASRVLPRRWLVIGGEAARWELVDRLLESDPACRVLNHYGPTEATVGACTFEVVSGEPRRSATVPVGRPLANARAYVLDHREQPLPPGVPGELCISGHGVTRGYVGQPDQTELVFRADQLSETASRLYRTGDRARMLRDGSIEFLGRVDGQLKIRGYRVEPGEIEAVLRRHPDVEDAVVVGRPQDGEGDGEPVLVGYVVAPNAPQMEDVQTLLRDALPAYMIPSKLVRLDSLPLTASGKVDRGALPEPGDSPRESEYVAPRTSLEESLAEIWEELLGVKPVGVHDDFFALGGHSLLATQVVIRIRRTHADVPLHSIFDFPTVAGLAAVVAEAEGDASAVGAK